MQLTTYAALRPIIDRDLPVHITVLGSVAIFRPQVTTR